MDTSCFLFDPAGANLSFICRFSHVSQLLLIRFKSILMSIIFVYLQVLLTNVRVMKSPLSPTMSIVMDDPSYFGSMTARQIAVAIQFSMILSVKVSVLVPYN